MSTVIYSSNIDNKCYNIFMLYLT